MVPVGIDDAWCVRHTRGMFTARRSGVGSDHQRKSPAETVKYPAWALIGQAWGVRWTGQTPSAALGREGQGEATCFAGEASGQGEEALSEGLGSCHWSRPVRCAWSSELGCGP